MYRRAEIQITLFLGDLSINFLKLASSIFLTPEIGQKMLKCKVNQL